MADSWQASESDPSVIIVGLGPTGETLANILGQRGVSTLCIERDTKISDAPRAGALDGDALRVWQSLNLLDEIKRDLTLGQAAQFVDADQKLFLEVRPSEYPYGSDTLAFFYQPTLSETLRSALRRFPHVRLLLGHELVALQSHDDHVEISITRAGEGEEVRRIRAPWLLACDGARSTVRQILGVPFLGRSYPQRWLVADAEAESPPASPVFRFVCDPTQPQVRTYLTKNHYRGEWMLLPGDDPSEVTNPAYVRDLLKERAEFHDIRIRRTAVYTYHSRVASSWRHRRVLLLGDAAHVSPPFAGQGVSNGVRDAANVGWKLDLVVRGAVRERLLDSYELERRRQVRRLNRVALWSRILVQLRNPSLAMIRNGLLRLLNRWPWFKQMIRENRLVYPARLRRGIVATGFLLDPIGRRNGQFLPQPKIKSSTGVEMLLDETLGNGFAALGWECDPREFVHRKHRQALERLGTTYVELRATSRWDATAQETGGEHTTIGYDVTGQMERWFGSRRSVAIIRPDRYVFSICRPTRLPQTTETLFRHLDLTANGDTRVRSV